MKIHLNSNIDKFTKVAFKTFNLFHLNQKYALSILIKLKIAKKKMLSGRNVLNQPTVTARATILGRSLVLRVLPQSWVTLAFGGGPQRIGWQMVEWVVTKIPTAHSSWKEHTHKTRSKYVCIKTCNWWHIACNTYVHTYVCSKVGGEVQRLVRWVWCTTV